MLQSFMADDSMTEFSDQRLRLLQSLCIKPFGEAIVNFRQGVRLGTLAANKSGCSPLNGFCCYTIFFGLRQQQFSFQPI